MTERQAPTVRRLLQSIQITEDDDDLQLVITLPNGDSAWMGYYDPNSIAANVLLSFRKAAREALTHPEPDRAALVERLNGAARHWGHDVCGNPETCPMCDIAGLFREAAAALESIATREWIPLLDPPDEERALYDAAEYVKTGGMPSPEAHMRLCKVALKLAPGATPMSDRADHENV